MFDLLDVYICSDMCCDLYFDIYIYIFTLMIIVLHTHIVCICNLQLIIYLKNPLQKKNFWQRCLDRPNQQVVENHVCVCFF